MGMDTIVCMDTKVIEKRNKADRGECLPVLLEDRCERGIGIRGVKLSCITIWS